MKKKSVLACFSDQAEHNHHAIVATLLKERVFSVLVNTRPNFDVKQIKDRHAGVFIEGYGWENICNKNFNVFTSDWRDEEEARSILDEVGWPQTLDEVLASDQYSHWKISGRFYQKEYNRSYLLNSFLITYRVALKAISDNKPDIAYFYIIRDANKLGAMCACLKTNLPALELTKSNIYGAKFLRLFKKSQFGVLSQYFVLDDSLPRLFLNMKEEFVRGENESAQRVGELEVCQENLTGLLGREKYNVTQRNREGHNKIYDLRFSNVLRLQFKNFLKLVRRSVNRVVRKDVRDKYPEVPFHKKNAKHLWSSALLKDIWQVLKMITSIRLSVEYCLLPKKKLDKKKFIVALHYFPESSTIAGVSWLGCKNEVELFSHFSVRENFPPDETVFIEHPVNLVKGERSRLFWRALKILGYNDFQKSSKGIDLDNLTGCTIITITGSVAIEAASKSIPVVVVKNSHLLAIEGVSHVSDYVVGQRESVNIIGQKMTPDEYMELSSCFGLETDDDVAELIYKLTDPPPFSLSSRP